MHKKNNTSIEKTEVIVWLKEIVKALKYLHIELNVIHRDVKPLNIFIKNKHIKLADFGLSKTMEMSKYTITGKGTNAYFSPERWNNEAYNFKSDIWALGNHRIFLIASFNAYFETIGVTFYEMCTNDIPFYYECEVKNAKTPVLAIKFKEYQSLLEGYTEDA